MGLLNYIVKYVVFGINLFFTLIGIGLIVVGVVLHFKLEDIYHDEMLVDQLNIVTIVIIVLGCITFLIAFSGCCGSISDNKCLLITFAVFLFVVIGTKIYVTAAMNKNVRKLGQAAQETLKNAFDNPDDNVTFHIFEASFKCCGTTGPDSYEEILPVSRLPPSCCADANVINIESECLIEDAFTSGCLQVIADYFNDIGKQTKTVFIWFIVFEILELIASIYLIRSVIEKRRIKN